MCEVHVDGTRLEHVLKFKYLGYVFDESGIDGAKCRSMLGSGVKVTGAIISLLNAWSLKYKSARVLHACFVIWQ